MSTTRADRPAVGELPEYEIVELDRVCLDESTQPRADIDEDTVREYMQRMQRGSGGLVLDREGVRFTPITVFSRGQQLWLADGFHRVEAARRRGWEYFQARLRQGGLREAVEFSLGANARHGKRRTNADKRRAVARALEDAGWSAMSDSQIARMCCVSQPFVSKMRRTLERQGDIQACVRRRGADGKLYRVGNIGRDAAPELDAPEEGPQELAPDEVDSAPQAPAYRSTPRLEVGGGLEPGSVGVLLVRRLRRRDWYEVADAGVALLEEGGVLIVPQTLDLSFAVSHLMRERVDYLGATVLPGPHIYQVWSARPRAVPTQAGSLDELVGAVQGQRGTILEFCPIRGCD